MITANTISEEPPLRSVFMISCMKTLGSRIAHYRNIKGMSQASLAKACGWASQSRVGNYERDTREPTLEDISLMARALGINESQLLMQSQTTWRGLDSASITGREAGISNVQETAQPYRANKEYPLISWVAAGCWQESCDNFQPGSADEWLISDANAGPHGYWLEVKGASMLPKFTEGMRILVKPEGFDLVSGKFYIAKMLDSGETTFKQYVRDAGMEFLQPLNPAYPTLQITDNVRIIGRVVDTKMEPTLL